MDALIPPLEGNLETFSILYTTFLSPTFGSCLEWASQTDYGLETMRKIDVPY
jgi:hypothetical protein